MGAVARMFGTTALLAVIALVGGLSVLLISERMLTPQLREDFACMFGLVEFSDPECLTNTLIRTRKRFEEEMALQRQVMSAEKARVENERAKLTAFLTDPDIVMVQAKDGVEGAYVVVAASYQDAAARTGLIAAMCYAARDAGGLDPRLPLGQMNSAGHITDVLPSDMALTGFGFQDSHFETAKGLCPWPSSS